MTPPFIPPGPLHSPVLLVVFNRPDTTARVFERIRQAKPRRLYVAADAPRSGKSGEADQCAQVRDIATRVDWDCELKTSFQEENLGCGLGPVTAYNWFFDQEPEGIILEDDCLPDLSFFWYCQELLEKYRHDTRVMHITGTNFQHGWQRDPDYSYYFSLNPHEWGWASWRRAWQLYDFSIRHFAEVEQKGYLKDTYSSELEYRYRFSKWRNTYGKNEVSWWDYQWVFSLHIHHGLAIVPNQNLVQNIGFGAGATHTVSTRDPRGLNQAHTIDLPLRHPPFVVQDKVADRRYFSLMMRRLLLRKMYGWAGIKGYDARG